MTVLLCSWVDQHRDLAADRAVFDGVADEIVDRLAHPVGIAHGDDSSAAPRP